MGPRPTATHAFNNIQIILIMIATCLAVAGGGFLLDWALLGNRREFLYSDALAGAVAGLLALLALKYHNRAQHAIIARLRIISEVNHHVRNAIAGVLYSVELSKNEELIQITSSAVERIDWTLREILPRENFPDQSANIAERRRRQAS